MTKLSPSLQPWSWESPSFYHRFLSSSPLCNLRIFFPHFLNHPSHTCICCMEICTNLCHKELTPYIPLHYLKFMHIVKDKQSVHFQMGRLVRVRWNLLPWVASKPTLDNCEGTPMSLRASSLNIISAMVEGLKTWKSKYNYGSSTQSNTHTQK